MSGNGESRVAHWNAVQTVQPPTARRRMLRRLQAVLQRSGASRLFVRASGASGALILMYHSVEADRESAWIDPANQLSAAIFEHHVRFLAEHRNVVPLGEIVEMLRDGESPNAGTVAITFDDGYLDTLSVAAPLLAKYELPATLFLPTGYIERGQAQWIDELFAIFTTRSENMLRDEATGEMTDLRNPALQFATYRRIAGELLTADLATRTAMLACLREQLRPDGVAPRTTMNWDDVKTLLRDYPLFSIGGHTRNHVDLTHVPADTVQAEISQSLNDIESAIGVQPVDFSCPYNRANNGVRSLLREASLRCAMADGAHPLLRPGVDLLSLPRVDAQTNRTQLAFITSGAWPTLSNVLLGRS